MTHHPRAAVLLVVALCVAACGGATARHPDMPPSPASLHAAADVPPTIAADDDEPPARPPGPLTRAEVDALVAHGLGALLATVRLSPVLAQGRFVGFRLDAARDLDAWRASGADVRVGDVIVRVNGARIERPEQALWAFERLRIAPAIELDVLRAGAAVTIRSPILDAPRDG